MKFLKKFNEATQQMSKSQVKQAKKRASKALQHRGKVAKAEDVKDRFMVLAKSEKIDLTKIFKKK